MKNYLKEFHDRNHEQLLKILLEMDVLEKDDAEKLVYGLREITESIEEVYNSVIPKIIDHPKESKDFILNLLWDIREEFRHIQYHINDGKITEL